MWMGAMTAVGMVTSTQQVAAQTSPSFGPPQTNPFGLTGLGYASKPYYVDIDNDGDLDLFASEYYASLVYYENTGTATVPQFAQAQVNPFGFVAPTGTYIRRGSVTFQDMDNDGDFDLWFGDYYGSQVTYYQNTGTNVAPAFAPGISSPFGFVSPGGYSYMANLSTGDLDGDGDFDLLMGEYYGNLLYYENTGTNVAPAFASGVSNPFGLINTSYYATPNLIDFDSDGDLDLMVGGEYGTFAYFENTGSTTAPAFTTPLPNPFNLIPVGSESAPSFADLDNDGDLDMTTGDEYGNFIYQEDTSSGVAANLAPVVTLASNDSICVNDTLFAGLVANDPEGDALTLSATSSNQAVVMDANIQISGTAPNYQVSAVPSTPGVTDIILSVMDSANTVLDTLTLTVDACIPNVPPVITGPTNVSVCEGDTIALPFTANDANGDPLTFQALSNNQSVVMNANMVVTGTAPNFSISIIPSGLGLATVALIANDGAAQDTAFFDLEVEDCSVGLDEDFFAKSFEVYPNPATEQLHCKLELHVPAEQIKLELVDLAGRLVVTEEILGQGMSLQGVLDVEQVRRGIYFLRVTTELYQFNRKIILR